MKEENRHINFRASSGTQLRRADGREKTWVRKGKLNANQIEGNMKKGSTKGQGVPEVQ